MDVLIKGFVYQAGIPCQYHIDFTNVKSISRIDAAAPAKGHPDTGRSGVLSGTVTDMKGRSFELNDLHLYYRGSFDSGYGWWGVAAIRGKCLSDADALTLSLGMGGYDVPLSQIARISFKDKFYLSQSGFRCPFVGKPLQLVALVGQLPKGRVALYPSSVAEVSLSVTEDASRGEKPSDEGPGATSSLSCFRAGASTPFLGLSNVRAEVYSPAINWETTDASLAFRAALEDYSESGRPNADSSAMLWDKTFECRSVPVQVGQEYWAVPFSAIRDLHMDAKGVLAISLRDGSMMHGSPYRNWKGLVGDAPEGETRLTLQKLPARVSFLEPGTLFAMGLGISGSLVESQQSPYGQRGYLDWAMTLTIENSTAAALQFGKDILLMDCTHEGLFDGAFVSYATGAPDKKPEISDFDAESQAYSLANFERWWSDGTMRGFRNGGTYVFGDPPDHGAEETICNSTLAAGATVKLVKEFTQGSYVRPESRVLVVLPAVSRGAARSRLVLSFVKPDRPGDTWVLDSVRAVRLTRDDLLAALKAAGSDPAFGVLALHWLTDLDPAAAAPFIDQNIRTPGRGLLLVASIQLLTNSHLQPGAGTLAAIRTLAGGDDWAARVAKRYMGGTK
jgi:hypothetical protein